MKETVLITGLNGMVAQKLAQYLKKDYSIRFLTRNVSHGNSYEWNIEKKYIDSRALIGVDHVIHLAGTPISHKRWTKNRKGIILSSRIDSATLIQEELKKHKVKINSFISASAIGYYGAKTTNKIFSEESQKGNDFISDVCFRWEKAAQSFELKKQAKRTAILRIGIILSETGGILEKLVSPIKYYLGSNIGDGKQYMPWIHIKDLCGIIKFILDNKHIKGTFNAVSPQHITNTELTKEVAKVLNKSIILPNIPKFIIKRLFGEMSIIILDGSKVSSEKIIKNGYNFEYRNLNKALNNIIRNI